MEPKALANLNGMLVASPVKGARDAQTAPSTPMNRRDSVAWMRTPPEQLGTDDKDGGDWDGGMLTPVPVTPAPEAIARYAENITPETPGVDDTVRFSSEALLMRTCPPQPNTYTLVDGSILGEQKDEGVLVRLMAARRKSLQYAPKVGSPLAKTWSG